MTRSNGSTSRCETLSQNYKEGEVRPFGCGGLGYTNITGRGAKLPKSTQLGKVAVFHLISVYRYSAITPEPGVSGGTLVLGRKKPRTVGVERNNPKPGSALRLGSLEGVADAHSPKPLGLRSGNARYRTVGEIVEQTDIRAARNQLEPLQQIARQ